MQALKNWIEGKLGLPANSTSNALAATFQMALLELLSKNITTDHDEETITAAILGAFTATAPFCCLAYQPTVDPSYLWVRYAKSGSGLMTEPGRGADFALIICLPDGTFRLSVFQAKMSKGVGSFSIRHISPSRVNPQKLPEPQFLRLADYGLDVLSGLSDASSPPTFSDLHWLHYLVYESNKIRCSSIMSHQAVHTNLIARRAAIKHACAALWGSSVQNFPKGWQKIVESLWLSQLLPHQAISGTVHFDQLLARGADEHASPTTGWLILSDINKARSAVDVLYQYMPVYSAQISPCPEPTPSDPGHSPNNTRKAVQTKDVISSRDDSAQQPRQTDLSNDEFGPRLENRRRARRGPGGKP